MFDLVFSNQAKRFLKKIDSQTAKRILERIEKLQKEPFPSDVKRVVNRKEKIFRIRIGDYRVQYSVLYDKNILFISEIEKRPRAY
ncbi:type II toxin-antitoxin system RelE/ParE family toxin [Candidatus Woesearchaeota archaeon]|nr:type II toxin-antitoxin system RelE/ParE family toxin [Candidatus Woesearchaeota archaeon]